jgi:hypothetical protein
MDFASTHIRYTDRQADETETCGLAAGTKGPHKRTVSPSDRPGQLKTERQN